VNVTAIDRAGNEGPFPMHMENSQGGPTPVPDSAMLQSGAYPVNPVATVPLAMTPTRLGREGTTSMLSDRTGLQLHAAGDRSGQLRFARGVRRHRRRRAVAVAGAPVTLPGDFPSIAGQAWAATAYYEGDPSIDNSCPATGDMLVDGEFIYVASGQFLRIFSVSQPLLPR